VRQGTTPTLSALAVIIVAITVVGAVIYEVLRRAEQKKADAAKATALAAEAATPVAVAA
jgi:spermidine/putrescine transport system permease protein